MANRKKRLLQGNGACVEGAIYAGMSFYAGYPITPSTEIAEGCARQLPKLGGRFIQMEDEIASIAAIIGASVTGKKVLTGTSGPGYSLMSELLGYAYMTETPIVVANVQRGGPSTGLPTKVGQADTMQARWGTHGDYNAIAVAPSTVGECLTETIRAFNLAERFRTPVTILLDEVMGHMREIIEMPEKGEHEVFDRVKPTCSPEEFEAYAMTENLVSPMPSYGEGYRYNVTGLTHDTRGFSTNRTDETIQKLDKLFYKIENYKNEIFKSRVEMVEDADVIFISYGTVSRAALQAMQIARKAGAKVGSIQLYTIWPFDYEMIKEATKNCKKVIVAEMNMGQICHEVQKVLDRNIKLETVQRYDGEIITPMELLQKLEEVL